MSTRNCIDEQGPKKPKIIKVGYWWSKLEPHLPMPEPQEHPWEGKTSFLAGLKKIEGRSQKRAMKGWSTCRLCGKKNGSGTYEKGRYEWPDGLSHYVDAHNVKPRQSFVDWVMKTAYPEPPTLRGPVPNLELYEQLKAHLKIELSLMNGSAVIVKFNGQEVTRCLIPL